jgi:NAD(P)-dependent dehydrogenase (short-subunit alcohol dehydrogenase family)
MTVISGSAVAVTGAASGIGRALALERIEKMAAKAGK